MNQAESGRSLIEMLAVIGIIGVLSVGVVSTVRWGLVSGQTFSLQADVESAAQQLQELCSWNSSWEDCQPQSTDLDLPKNFKVVVNGETDLELKVCQVDDECKGVVPVRVCRRLLNPTYTNWTEDLIESITVNSGSAIPLPLSDGIWKTACGSSSFAPAVTMEFTVIK